MLVHLQWALGLLSIVLFAAAESDIQSAFLALTLSYSLIFAKRLVVGFQASGSQRLSCGLAAVSSS